MNKKISFVLSVLLLTCVMQAKAENTSYIGVSGGMVGTSFVPENVDANNMSAGVRLYFGKKLSDLMTFEIGYMTALSSTLKRKYTDGSTLEYVSRADAFDFSLLLSPFGQLPGLKFRAGLALMGMHIDKKENDPSWHHTVHNEATKYKTGLIAGVLYEFPISDVLSMAASYTRYQNLSGDDTDTWYALDHSNNVISFGVNFKF